jgi:tellurite resistance protein TehA-like permease
VKQLPPAYFALVMATGIVSISAQDFGLPVLAMGLFAFNLAAYAVLVGLTRVCSSPT